jgi:hypothetical protein
VLQPGQAVGGAVRKVPVLVCRRIAVQDLYGQDRRTEGVRTGRKRRRSARQPPFLVIMACLCFA